MTRTKRRAKETKRASDNFYYRITRTLMSPEENEEFKIRALYRQFLNPDKEWYKYWFDIERCTKAQADKVVSRGRKAPCCSTKECTSVEALRKREELYSKGAAKIQSKLSLLFSYSFDVDYKSMILALKERPHKSIINLLSTQLKAYIGKYVKAEVPKEIQELIKQDIKNIRENRNFYKDNKIEFDGLMDELTKEYLGDAKSALKKDGASLSEQDKSDLHALNYAVLLDLYPEFSHTTKFTTEEIGVQAGTLANQEYCIVPIRNIRRTSPNKDGQSNQLEIYQCIKHPEKLYIMEGATDRNDYYIVYVENWMKNQECANPRCESNRSIEKLKHYDQVDITKVISHEIVDGTSIGAGAADIMKVIEEAHIRCGKSGLHNLKIKMRKECGQYKCNTCLASFDVIESLTEIYRQLIENNHSKIGLLSDKKI